MKTTLTLKASPEMAALMNRLGELPEVAVQAVERGMARAGQIALGAAVRFRFTGKGPFPHAEHRLGVRTNRLRKSLRATLPERTGARTVEMRFGSNVSYFALHEFGFNGRVQVRGHTRRNVAATYNNKGGQTKATINQRKISILVKGRDGYSYVKPHTRNLTIVARRPLGTQLEDETTSTTYYREIGRELRLALAGNGEGPLA